MVTNEPVGGGVSVQEFRAKPGAGLKAALFVGGGILFLLVLLVQFVLLLAVKTRSGQEMMPGLIGGLSVVGIGLIARGAFLLRGVRRVVAGPDALVAEGFASRTEVRWSDVTRLERAKRSPLLGGGAVEVLTLLGDGDRPLLSIPATVEPFEDLCRLAEARSTLARGRQTYNPADNDGRQRVKAARKMKWVAAAFLLFTLGMGTGFVAGVNEELHERRYATEGLTVPARVVRRYMVRVTPRLEYAFADAAGRDHTREMMMAQDAWDELAGAATVDVEYLPSDPKWNRPVRGESPEEAHFGGKFLLVTGGGFLLFGLLFVTSVLGFDLQSENGRTTLLRRGRVLRQWGGSAAAGGQAAVATVSGTFPVPVPPPPAPVFGPPSPTSAPLGIAAGRPVGIVVLGVLAILFGLAGALLAVARAAIASRGVIELPDGRVLITGMSRWLSLWSAADGLLAVLLLAAGVLLVRLRRTGRSLAMAVAALQIVSSAGELALTVADMARSEVAGPAAGQMLAANAGAIIGKVLGAVFPAVLLVILSRRRVAGVLK